MTRKRFDSAPQINVKDEGMLIQQVAGSTTNLLEVKSHSGATLMAVDYAGTMTSGASNTFTYLAATASASLPANTTIGAVSPTELGYLDGVTNAIQTQLDAKAPLASPTFTGTVTLPPNSIALGTTTTGNYVASLVAGTGISLANNTGEGATPTITNTGVTFASGTANQITVSGGTGSINIGLASSPTVSGTVTAGGFSAVGTMTLNRAGATGWNAGANINFQVDGTTYATLGIDSTNSAVRSSGSFSVPTTSGYAFGDHGFSNFWRPVDAYNNSYFRIATGSWYSDAGTYYFRNASSTTNLTIESSGNTTVRGVFQIGQPSATMTSAGALQLGNAAADFSFGSWASAVSAGKLANCNDIWEEAIHDSNARVVSSLYYSGNQITFGRDLGWGKANISLNTGLYVNTDNQVFLGVNRTGVFTKLNDDAWFSDPQNGQINFRNSADNNWGYLNGFLSNQSSILYKKDIQLISGVAQKQLFNDMLNTGVYNFKYTEDDDSYNVLVGPILEDAPAYLRRNPSHTGLLITCYTGMLHGAMKEIVKRLEAVEKALGITYA